MGSVALEGFGSGGAGLNFKVVGGLTQPVNPKENTIWVDTDVDITSYIFSATEPAEPAEGMVWITIGRSGTVEFNALKKNSLRVYPISAKQYVGGAWVDKTAKSWQGGEWVEWVTYIYNDGVAAIPMSITAGTNCVNWILANDHLECVRTSSNAKEYKAYMSDDIVDLSSFTKIKAIAEYTQRGSNDGVVALGVYSTRNFDYDSNIYKAASALPVASQGRTTIEVDISSVSKGYVGVDTRGWASAQSFIAKVYQIWFE